MRQCINRNHHIFKENNFSCVSFKNTANDEDYDPSGVDFEIKFKNGVMPLQLKRSEFYTNKHKKYHPDIPLIVSYVGEQYEKRELKLLNLHDKYFSLKK